MAFVLLQEKLPAAKEAGEPLPEGLMWLLLTGEVRALWLMQERGGGAAFAQSSCKQMRVASLGACCAVLKSARAAGHGCELGATPPCCSGMWCCSGSRSSFRASHF